MNVKKLLAMLLTMQMALALCLAPGAAFPVSAEENVSEAPAETVLSLDAVEKPGSYADYLARYDGQRGGNLGAESAVVAVRAENAENLGPDTTLESGMLRYAQGSAFADFALEVEKAGLYRIALQYAQTEKTNKQILIGLMLDQAYPFTEAAEIELPRIFTDQSAIRVDGVGNEIAPKQAQVFDVQTAVLKNTNGHYESEYVFWLDAGRHTVSILGGDTEFLLAGVQLLPERTVPTYADYLATHPGQDTAGLFIKRQAESAYLKSDSVLYPNYDRVNAATEDQTGALNNPKYIRINTIGGSLWKTPGQWISWQIEAPQTGYYNLGVKYRQNFLDGLFTSRDIYIDGELLFEEMQGVQFNYDDEWRTMTLTDGQGQALKIYLEAGVHEIRMEVTMGKFADALRTLSDCIYDVNDLYRRIIMITSTNPDSYTDYFLTQRVPDLLETMERSRDILSEQIDGITALAGGRGSKTSALDTLRVQLDLFLKDPEEITNRLSTFKDNISAMGSWLVDIQSQALQLDYLYLKSPDVETPDAGAGFWANTSYGVRRFFASFDDSTAVMSGEGGSEAPRIKVWLSAGSAGRDQAQVLKDLIDESFTPETGVVVDLELVQGSLIEATLAGMGPDVALLVAEDQPVNFAIRGALYDLTNFADFDEVRERFYPSAVEPFWYNGGCYALPDTQVFNMLFYRTDVFADLGLEAPQTWEEFYALLPVVQRNNLQITVQDIFPTLYFQRGGSYYNETGTVSLLDSATAIEAMKTYTDLYTTYGFEVKTDFYSRFRSGELVLSIQPYNMYNQLMVAAPEINGLWEMVPIPGTLQPDGTVNRAQNSTVTGSIMLNSAKNKEAAWEFMKWWSRDDTKASYGISLEGLMGPSARFTPANKATMALLPWSNAELAGLQDAMALCVGIPQLPGSYYTSRGLTNAFRSIVYNSATPQTVMKLQTRYINEEITRKREEFGLTTYEEEAAYEQ